MICTRRIGIAVAALLLAVVCGCRPQPPAPTPAAAAKPDAAVETPSSHARPSLDITTLDGSRFSLAAQRGHWVLVNFWATWCSPCLKEMPELSALDARRDDLAVLGLAYQEIDPESLQAFLKRHPVGYPIAIVDMARPPADFPTPLGLPMTYLIAPDGRIAEHFIGPVTAQMIEAAIATASPR